MGLSWASAASKQLPTLNSGYSQLGVEVLKDTEHEHLLHEDRGDMCQPQSAVTSLERDAPWRSASGLRASRILTRGEVAAAASPAKQAVGEVVPQMQQLRNVPSAKTVTPRSELWPSSC